MLPATCQGIMAVEIREDDYDTAGIVKKINNHKSDIESRAERSFLNHLEGGCQIPVGVYSMAESYSLYIEGMVGSLDGKVVIRERIIGNDSMPESLGKQLAQRLIEKGAQEILGEIRSTLSK